MKKPKIIYDNFRKFKSDEPSGGIRYEVKTITPEWAQGICLKNIDPEKYIDFGFISSLAKTIKKGGWVMNGSAIKLDETDTLLDGWHRLSAILRSGVEVQSLVITLPAQPKAESLGIMGLHPTLHARAMEFLNSGNACGFTGLVGDQERGDLILQNEARLRSLHLFEKALYNTYIHGPTWHPSRWLPLFESCDKKRLEECGDTPKPTEPLTLFRGVQNSSHAAFIRGLSWTTSPAVAAWFAIRGGAGAAPAVYRMMVPPERIFLMTNERNELEAIIDPRGLRGLTRLKEIPAPTHPRESPASGQTGGASGMGLGG